MKSGIWKLIFYAKRTSPNRNKCPNGAPLPESQVLLQEIAWSSTSEWGNNAQETVGLVSKCSG